MRQRAEAVEKFKKGEYDILVSNDLLARGMNFPNVSFIIHIPIFKLICRSFNMLFYIIQVDHVINYDLPTPENVVQYIHAVGRTGRAGNSGRATSFFDPFGPDTLLARCLIQVSMNNCSFYKIT
jgi:ATP-dependent RNA helicase DDX3X